MYFDRFDICTAYYLYFTEYHSGMYSEEYRRLSKLLTYYSPPAGLCDADDLEENARVIYDNLVSSQEQE